MPTLHDAILVLFPTADFLPGGTVTLFDHADGKGPQIGYWDTAALGPQPSAAALAAVTDAQVAAAQTAALRNAAITLVQSGTDPAHYGTRGGDAAIITQQNDDREAVWAMVKLICARANIAVPTATDIANEIAVIRTGTNYVGATDPATIAAAVGTRIVGAAALNMVTGAIQGGGGDPPA